MTTITLDLTAFRAQFQQFASTVTFPDATIQGQFDMGTAFVQPRVGCQMPTAARRQALYLMTAHLLALSVIIAAGNYTGQPGTVTASSVGDVSVTLQPPPVKSQWAWWLNLTPYGAQLDALLQAQAVGGMGPFGGLPEIAGFRRVGGVFRP